MKLTVEKADINVGIAAKWGAQLCQLVFSMEQIDGDATAHTIMAKEITPAKKPNFNN